MTISDPNKDYYHINRLVPWSSFKKWSVNDVIDIGGESNPYFNFFETQQKSYEVTDSQGVKKLVPGAHFIGGVTRGEINTPHIAGIAHDLVQHFVAYIRELIWEDIRKSEFPHLPSRQRCIWLIPNLEGIAFWLKRLDLQDQEFQIARVRVQGRLHTGSDEQLLGDSEPMSVTVKKARQYWLGVSNNSSTHEILFEGRIKVQEFIDPENIA